MSLKINNLLLSSMETQTREIVNSVNIKKNILIPNSIPIIKTIDVNKFISWEINPNLLTSIVLVSNFKNIITNFTTTGEKNFFISIHPGIIEDPSLLRPKYLKVLDYNQIDFINDTQFLYYFPDSITNSKYYLTIGVANDINVSFNDLPPTLTFFNY
jgi:hypothetical protein